MTSDADALTPERAPVAPSRITVTPELHADLLRDATRWALLRPNTVVLFVLTIIVTAVFVAIGLAWDAPVLLVLGLVLVVSEALVAVMQARSVRAAVRLGFPVGAEHGLALTHDSLDHISPRQRSQVAYAVYSAAERRRSIVLLVRRGSRARGVIPFAMLGDAGLEDLRERIARAAAR